MRGGGGGNLLLRHSVEQKLMMRFVLTAAAAAAALGPPDASILCSSNATLARGGLIYLKITGQDRTGHTQRETETVKDYVGGTGGRLLLLLLLATTTSEFAAVFALGHCSTIGTRIIKTLRLNIGLSSSSSSFWQCWSCRTTPDERCVGVCVMTSTAAAAEWGEANKDYKERRNKAAMSRRLGIITHITLLPDHSIAISQRWQTTDRQTVRVRP